MFFIVYKCFYYIPTSRFTAVFPIRYRTIALRFWSYPVLDDFSISEPLWKNQYAHTVPLLTTITPDTSITLQGVLNSDLKRELLFLVCNTITSPSRPVDFQLWCSNSLQTKILEKTESKNTSLDLLHLKHSSFESLHLLKTRISNKVFFLFPSAFELWCVAGFCITFLSCFSTCTRERSQSPQSVLSKVQWLVWLFLDAAVGIWWSQFYAWEGQPSICAPTSPFFRCSSRLR